MWVLILLHIDLSGVQQVFGPFYNRKDAEDAKRELMDWPALIGVWDISPMNEFGESFSKHR